VAAETWAARALAAKLEAAARARVAAAGRAAAAGPVAMVVAAEAAGRAAAFRTIQFRRRSNGDPSVGSCGFIFHKVSDSPKRQW
jgi:hypothetical protein